MDFANEHYIRLYTRNTTTWIRLGWDGQNVLTQVLRRVDLSGVLDIEDLEPWEAAVIHCNAPEDVAKRGMTRCLELGCLVHNGRYLVAPKYRDANEANKSDKQRQLESRHRRRASAMVTGSHEPSRAVTPRHKLSQNVTVGGDVTPRDDGSQNVTGESRAVTEPSHAVTSGHTRSQTVTHTGAVHTGAVRCGAGTDAPPISASDDGSHALTTAPLLAPAEKREFAARLRSVPIDPEVEASTVGVDLGAPAPRWRELASAFERVVLGGRKQVLDARHRSALVELGDTLDDWDGDDPVGFFERVLEAYAGSKRDAGKVAELRWFCSDFATWAQRIADGHSGAGAGSGGVPGGGPQCRELLP